MKRFRKLLLPRLCLLLLLPACGKKQKSVSLQGGILKRNNIRPFYLELLHMLDALPTA